MSGPAPKPSKIRLLEGNPGHRVLNRTEPQYEPGVEDRPDWLLPEADAEWDRVYPQLMSTGILSKVDRSVLSAYCQAWARYVEAEIYLTIHGMTQTVHSKANGVFQQARPQVAIASAQYKLMLAAAAKLGLSPADRTRIHTPEPRRDPLDDLLSGTG